MSKSNIFFLVFVFFGLFCMSLVRRFVNDNADGYVLLFLIAIIVIAYIYKQLNGKK